MAYQGIFNDSVYNAIEGIALVQDLLVDDSPVLTGRNVRIIASVAKVAIETTGPGREAGKVEGLKLLRQNLDLREKGVWQGRRLTGAPATTPSKSRGKSCTILKPSRPPVEQPR